MISGLLSSVAGLIMMARANSAKADYGSPYTLQCVLIAVLGGIDPNGGFGKISGVTMAILILQFLSSGLNMFNNVSNFYRDVIWGGVLILVLVFNKLLSWRSERRAVTEKYWKVKRLHHGLFCKVACSSIYIFVAPRAVIDLKKWQNHR